jgi:hypothetical protein
MATASSWPTIKLATARSVEVHFNGIAIKEKLATHRARVKIERACRQEEAKSNPQNDT